VRPFFPGYLFVRFCTNVDRWRCILSTHGVSSVMLANELPVIAPDKVVDRLRVQEELGLIKMCDPRDVAGRFKRGDVVKWSGPKADFDVVFEELVDKNRAVILFSWLGRETKQTVTLLTLR
jgi:transcriptional antiterminator RfaH